MGRLVPGLPGIPQFTSPNAPFFPTHTHTVSPHHSPTTTPPTFTLWKSLLHFPLISPFSLVLTRGGPLYSPLHARSQRCDRSSSPCAGSPSPLLSFCPGCPSPRRLCSIDLLLQPMLSVCFAPPAPWSLISLTLPSCPFSFSLFPLWSFFSYFPSVASYTTLGYRGGKSDREHKRKRKGEMEGMGVGGETGPLIFH